MGKFKKFDKSGGRGGFGKKHFGGDRKFDDHRGGQKKMFPATCSDCGNDCEVPFRPSGKQPVYCNDCFKNQGNSYPRFSAKSFDGNKSHDKFSRSFVRTPNVHAAYSITKEQFNSLNAKLDTILGLLNADKKEDEQNKVETKKIVKKVVKKETKKVPKNTVKKEVKKSAKKVTKKASAKKNKVKKK